jgi:hypothetical protein
MLAVELPSPSDGERVLLSRRSVFRRVANRNKPNPLKEHNFYRRCVTPEGHP